MGGIYCIRNKINGKMYVGNTNNFNRRWKFHFSRMKNGKHDNEKLQRSVNKHGLDNFEFVILEVIEDITLLEERERFFIKELNCISNGYNMILVDSTGTKFVHSVESKKKIGDAHRGKIITEEHKETLRKLATGRKLTPEQLTKLQTYNSSRIGSKATEEHKANMSKALTGLKRTKETLERMSLSRKGIVFSESWQENLIKSLGVKVEVTDKITKEVFVFDCIRDACRWLVTNNKPSTNKIPSIEGRISGVIDKDNLSAYGYKWKRLTTPKLEIM